MSRPLVVSDCDEVLLHMVSHFRDYLGEAHGSTSTSRAAVSPGRCAIAMAARCCPTRRCGACSTCSSTPRCTARPRSTARSRRWRELGEDADVVILTNLLDHRAERRAAQLAEHGIARAGVHQPGSQGPGAARRSSTSIAPSRVAFIDDLAQHHGLGRDRCPTSARLHLCGEPAGRAAHRLRASRRPRPRPHRHGGTRPCPGCSNDCMEDRAGASNRSDSPNSASPARSRRAGGGLSARDRRGQRRTSRASCRSSTASWSPGGWARTSRSRRATPRRAPAG